MSGDFEQMLLTTFTTTDLFEAVNTALTDAGLPPIKGQSVSSPIYIGLEQAAFATELPALAVTIGGVKQAEEGSMCYRLVATVAVDVAHAEGSYAANARQAVQYPGVVRRAVHGALRTLWGTRIDGFDLMDIVAVSSDTEGRPWGAPDGPVYSRVNSAMFTATAFWVAS